MAQQLEFRLTAKGNIKLNRLAKRVFTYSKLALHEGSEKIVKPNIVKRSPSLNEEKIFLSTGIITEPYIGPSAEIKRGFVGDYDERRFYKASNQLSIKNAVLSERVHVYSTPGFLKVYLGKTSLYNPGIAKPSIGFSWHGGGKDRSTDDSEAGAIWRNLLESWEFGGTFTVRPRTTKYLEPERWGPGRQHVLAKAITKTIPPFGMFRKGGMTSKNSLKEYFKTRIKGSIKREFG